MAFPQGVLQEAFTERQARSASGSALTAFALENDAVGQGDVLVPLAPSGCGAEPGDG